MKWRPICSLISTKSAMKSANKRSASIGSEMPANVATNATFCTSMTSTRCQSANLFSRMGCATSRKTASTGTLSLKRVLSQRSRSVVPTMTKDFASWATTWVQDHACSGTTILWRSAQTSCSDFALKVLIAWTPTWSHQSPPKICR